VEPKPNSLFAPGRSGDLWLGKQWVGSIGQVHPEQVRELKVDAEVGYMELDLTPLIEASSTPQFAGLDKFPTIQHDLGVLVPEGVTWKQVVDALSPQQVAFVSDYHGVELPAGYKGLTLRMTLANPDRTPTEAEAAELEATLLRRLERKVGAKPRG